MTAAYVVLSHRDPDQVERLARAILGSSPDARVFVTHDDRRAPAPREVDERMHVRSHGRATDWGSWELVEVTLDAFAWAREVAEPDVVVLVSGQCYPVRDLAGWEHEFLAAGGGWAGTAEALVYRSRWGRPYGDGRDDLTRYTYRWFRLPRLPLPRPVSKVLARVGWTVAHRVEPVASLRHVARGRGYHVGVRRRTPFGPDRPCMKGSQWLAVDRAMLPGLLADLAPGSALREVYERSLVPDESAIQTALAWRRPPRPDAPVSLDRWDVAADEPVTWTDPGDLGALRAGGSPFARKFDPVRSGPLLDALDAGR